MRQVGQAVFFNFHSYSLLMFYVSERLAAIIEAHAQKAVVKPSEMQSQVENDGSNVPPVTRSQVQPAQAGADISTITPETHALRVDDSSSKTEFRSEIFQNAQLLQRLNNEIDILLEIVEKGNNL